MPGPILRNAVVKYFGTPDRTEGSVNEPRERDEDGMRFNEKWLYTHPRNDPAGAAERVVFWRRYDYVGTRVHRAGESGWRDDPNLPEFLANHTGDHKE
jgi:hypothetical protein